MDNATHDNVQSTTHDNAQSTTHNNVQSTLLMIFFNPLIIVLVYVVRVGALYHVPITFILLDTEFIFATLSIFSNESANIWVYSVHYIHIINANTSSLINSYTSII
uniref:Uncharacterized protein n=1 Tax=Cacopsylla melanoneura TaxID=428564 RepID=A0A8D9F8W7_9HEMI